MKYFQLPEISINLLDDEQKTWLFDNGTNITEPAWTIRPRLIQEDEYWRIQPIIDKLPAKPGYCALIMVPAESVCKTHVDDKAGATGRRERITAINIPVNVHPTSVFQYMESLESDTVLETIGLQETHCWQVDIPHRVDNSGSPHNRVVLSFSFYETVDELYQLHTAG